MNRVRLSNTARAKCFADNGGQCHICSRPIAAGEAWEVEHVIALAAGGPDTPENRKPAHVKCHAEKTSVDRQVISKTERMRLKHSGAWRSPHPMNWRARKTAAARTK